MEGGGKRPRCENAGPGKESLMRSGGTVGNLIGEKNEKGDGTIEGAKVKTVIPEEACR